MFKFVNSCFYTLIKNYVWLFLAMQMNKKDIKNLAERLKKSVEEEQKAAHEYENHLRSAEKILKRKRNRK
jgi:hypothetical protein